jgi:hypothetical protein
MQLTKRRAVSEQYDSSSPKGGEVLMFLQDVTCMSYLCCFPVGLQSVEKQVEISVFARLTWQRMCILVARDVSGQRYYLREPVFVSVLS